MESTGGVISLTGAFGSLAAAAIAFLVEWARSDSQ